MAHVHTSMLNSNTHAYLIRNILQDFWKRCNFTWPRTTWNEGNYASSTLWFDLPNSCVLNTSYIYIVTYFNTSCIYTSYCANSADSTIRHSVINCVNIDSATTAQNSKISSSFQPVSMQHLLLWTSTCCAIPGIVSSAYLAISANLTVSAPTKLYQLNTVHHAVPAPANSASPASLAANSNISSSFTDPTPANSICRLSPLPNSMQPSNSCFGACPAATADTLRWVHGLCCIILQGVWLIVCWVTCIDQINTIHDFECICVQFCMIVHRYAMKL